MLLDDDYKVELLKKLPVYHRRIYEYQQISKALTPELEALLADVNFVLDEWFVETSSEAGIARQEKIAGIVPEIGDTLEMRRFKLFLKMTEKLPYTDSMLETKLRSMCGENGYRVIRKYKDYLMEIYMFLDDGNLFETSIEAVEGMIPCNLVTVYRNTARIRAETVCKAGAACRIVERISAGNGTRWMQFSEMTVRTGAAGMARERIQIKGGG